MKRTRAGLDAIPIMTQRLVGHSGPDLASGEESQNISYPRRKAGPGEKRDCTEEKRGLAKTRDWHLIYLFKSVPVPVVFAVPVPAFPPWGHP
jgi:hypothetical protein